MNNKYNFLKEVEKPARYVGEEYNAIIKENHEQLVSFALAFPDLYEVGMSHLGSKILYHVLNQERDFVAERVFMPWHDMEAKLREKKLSLFSLETKKELKKFDVVGFSLQYELSYTNVLSMLDLSFISLMAKERTIEEPIVIGGGPCAFNPEPLADFFDCFVIGDGEEVIIEIAKEIKIWKEKQKKGGRTYLLKKLSQIQGVYVPSLFEVTYFQNGEIDLIKATSGVSSEVKKRQLEILKKEYFPWKPVVSFVKTVHDRAMFEIFRGCTRGCRFCQAGMIYRPVRERLLKDLLDNIPLSLESTGYDELALLSLSSSDYSCLEELMDGLSKKLEEMKVNISLPSLRVDALSSSLANKAQKVRKSSMTIAPEAGTQRLRNAINKGVTEKNIEDAVRAILSTDCSTIKLYFMLGLPQEKEEDVILIIDEILRVLFLAKNYAPKKSIKINVSISSFVPKAHTPFQWNAQNTLEELESKQKLLLQKAEEKLGQVLGARKWRKKISISLNELYKSFLEATFARGDRRLNKVLLLAWQKGAKFDGWSECFNKKVWEDAFLESGINAEFYANRQISLNANLPWGHIDAGIEDDFLKREHEKAKKEEVTLDCRWHECTNCGACKRGII